MAAQHWGNCQICGREHKVSGQSIAKHGYTIRDGWQEGACYGSGGKPIQISCDLIEGALESAKRYIEQTSKKMQELLVNPTLADGTVPVMVREQTRGGALVYRSGVTMSLNDKGEPVATLGSGKTFKTWPIYTGVKTIEDATNELIGRYNAYLAHTIEQAEQSITYLTERLNNWKPAPLREISELEKAAAAPKVHFKAAKYGYKNTSLCASSAMGAQRNAGSRTTENREEVTCAACLKALKELDELPAKRAAEAEKKRLADIRWYERNIKDLQKELKKVTDDMVILNITQTMNAYTKTLEELKAAAPKAE